MTDPIDEITDKLLSGDNEGAAAVLGEYYRHQGIDPSKYRWLEILKRGGAVPDEMFEATPTGCFDEFEISEKPPTMALTGRLKEVPTDKQYLEAHPAVSPRFYVVDLDKPTCLKLADGGTETNIRSIQVYSGDGSKMTLLTRHRGKRVVVRFVSVFPEMTAHHQRPMVGDIDTVGPLR